MGEKLPVGDQLVERHGSAHPHPLTAAEIDAQLETVGTYSRRRRAETSEGDRFPDRVARVPGERPGLLPARLDGDHTGAAGVDPNHAGRAAFPPGPAFGEPALQSQPRAPTARARP